MKEDGKSSHSSAVALVQTGAAALERGDFERAMEALQQARTLAPSLASAWYLSGEVDRRREHFSSAASHFDVACQLEPRNPRFHFRLGMAAFEGGDDTSAARAFSNCLDLQPENDHAFNNLLAALCTGKRFADAVEHIEAHGDLSGRPQVELAYVVGAYLGLADERRQTGANDEALACYATALLYLDKTDDSVQAARSHRGMASILYYRDDDEALLHHAAAAVDLAPEALGYLELLGHSYIKLARFSDAIAVAERILALDATHGPALVLKAVAARHQGDEAGCLDALQAATAAHPDDVEAESALGYSLYQFGHIAEAWPRLRRRFERRDLAGQWRNFNAPRWQGESLQDRKVVYWGEQGIGDELMFANTIPALLERGADLHIECNRRLVPIYRRSFPESEVFPREADIHPRLQEPDIAFQIIAGDAAALLRRDEGAFPAHAGYILPDEARTSALRSRYQADSSDQLLVGIAWRTTNPLVKRWRNIALEHWAPVFELPGVRFVSLQYGVDEADKRSLGQFPVIHDESIDPLSDMDGFAAQTAAMDLVVSIDNSTVHLAGALGRPVWTLLPAIAEWRWQLAREDSPWYPSMRLFRQQELLVWSDVIVRVARELASFRNT